MHVTSLVNPPAFKLWTEEMTQGVQAGGQLHALLLVGSSAKALVDSIYCPEWLREPFTRRRTYAMYSESLWSNLPKDVHMMIVSVENVEVLAQDSVLIQTALESGVVRAIVFVVPDGWVVRHRRISPLPSADGLGLGNKMRASMLQRG